MSEDVSAASRNVRRYQITEDKEAEVLILTTKSDNTAILPIPIFYGY